MTSLAVAVGSGVIVEVRKGADWLKLPGCSSWTESGGEAPRRDIVAFEGVAQAQGRARAQQIEIEVSAYAPRHPAWREVRRAKEAAEAASFRLTTALIIYEAFSPAASKTAAIAADGTVTWAIQDPPDAVGAGLIAPGMAVALGETYAAVALGDIYMIEEVDGNDITVEAAAAVAAEAYGLILPKFRRGPIVCDIALADTSTLSADGEMTATLSLTPKGTLPEYSIVL